MSDRVPVPEMIIINGIRLYDCPFVDCTALRLTKDKHSVTAHLRIHSGAMPFECSCGKRYRWSYSLYSHTDREGEDHFRVDDHSDDPR